MSRLSPAFPIALACCVVSAWGQSNQRQPHIGYVYPAGGEQGSTFRIVVGGQVLRGAADAYVSGSGVHASVIQHYPPLRSVRKEQRDALARRMRELLDERWSELAAEGRVRAAPPWDQLAGLGSPKRKPDDTPDTEAVKLPEHALLYDLEQKSLRELLHVLHVFHNLRKGQPNVQLAETALLDVTIDRDAPPGEREIRLGTQLGLTNPLVFQVGTLPEVHELEVDDARVRDRLPSEPPLEPPVVVNGRIAPGDADRFRFRARRGQKLVIEVHARKLIPYLADAVPGWFQATLTLYDDTGNELAFADDYRFSPDPVLLFEAPADGRYELEIRDALYRGREDFVYRISLSAGPFITSVFPLGCRPGKGRFVAIDGWNLTSDRLFLAADPEDTARVRHTPLVRGKTRSNPVTYEVNALRARRETEKNDSTAEAERVRLPQLIDGCIAHPGDVDMFQFEGRAGDDVVAEVIARRLRSPLDSLLRLIDASGHIVAWNDDRAFEDGNLHTDLGVLTHHADSYCRARLPQDGTYYVQVSDAQARGGQAYAYRLRISPPRPDYSLRMTPSSINVRAGFAAPLTLYAQRADGFAGNIELVLKDAPPGLVLTGGRIPAGRDRVRAALSAARPLDAPVALRIEGRAAIDGVVVTRPVVPAQDMMQAFLYRHLTPSQELMVAVLGGRRLGGVLQLADKTRVRIPAGGVASVRISAPPHPRLHELELELSDPPVGITLRKVTPLSGALALELAAARDSAAVGLAGNLIVDAFINVSRGTPEDGEAARTRRVRLGVLPAIPFEVVSR